MSETSKFTKGAIVRLNSGGPKMTALSDAVADKILCQWFDRNGKTINPNSIRQLYESLKKLRVI